MKLLLALPLAALSAAFVIPDEQVLSNIAIEPHREDNTHWFTEKLPTKEQFKSWKNTAISEIDDSLTGKSRNVFDDAINLISKAGKKSLGKYQCFKSMTAFDARAWLDTAVENDSYDVFGGGDEPPPHHGPPHHGPPHHGPHHGRKTNQTIYELISTSKYTTKLAKFINKFPDILEALNGTTANYTVFAPTDEAFKRIHKHHKKPTDEQIKKILLYHVSPDFYPAGRVLLTNTIPTLYKEEKIGGPQRLRIAIGLGGLTVNFFSKVVAVNIFATNGVIHGVNHIILPPPPALKIIGYLPGEFSTLELALVKTGLDEIIEHASYIGGTLFAPSNYAFKRLGPKVNAFLFSSYGQKYLRAVLKYHIVANQTLYSDALYKSDSASIESFPKGHYHVDLPTILKDHNLSIDIGRFGRVVDVRINGYSSVAVLDGIAKDGVIQVVGNVLIPPKSLAEGAVEYWQGEELSVEEFKERFAPYCEME